MCLSVELTQRKILLVPKYNNRTGTGNTFLFQKGEMGKKKGVTGSKHN
jgi:hypothetical protein